MNAKNFCQLAGRLLSHSTAPYHEHRVRAELEQICTEQELDFRRDRFGNVLVRVCTAPGLRPVVFAAHLDHPGFDIVRQIGAKTWLARFRGGVPPGYFQRRTPVLLQPNAVPAKLGRCKDAKKRLFELQVTQRPIAKPEFAVWDVGDFTVRRMQIHARACDDLIGVVSALGTLIELKHRPRVHAYGVFSRAEEVGFHGALALAANGGLPKNSLLISLETSRELPGVEMGKGVILRVGDRASIFDPEASRYLAEVAADLKQRNKHFQSQRALMSGGTCEATAYQEFGFQSAAVCIALGNYHNCGSGNQIQPEYVAIPDACSMVDLLVAAGKRMPDYKRLTSRLTQRLHKLLSEAEPSLRKTA
jgi:endoglucanase